MIQPKYEYRLRWTRSHGQRDWKRRYFQTLSAARNLARFLTRPNAAIGTPTPDNWDEVYELSPIVTLEIDRREVGPWEPLEGVENLRP